MRAKVASLLGTTLLIVGACGQTPVPTPGPTSTAAPTPSATAAPTPSATTSPTSTPTPTPSAAPTSSPGNSAVAVVPASLPVSAGANYVVGFRMAARPDGGLFVAVPTTDGTILASLDAKGRVRNGWPVRLIGASGCTIDADPTDGSVRAACTIAESGTRAFALDASGRQMPGWPVDLPRGGLGWYLSDPTGLVEGDLCIVLLERKADKASARLIRVARDGSTRIGVSLRDPELVGLQASIGPDGTAYVAGGDTEETLISALTLDGLATGWPISVAGWASVPSFGRDGRIYVTAGRWPLDDEGAIARRSSSQIYAFARDGRLATGWPVQLLIRTTLPAPDVASPPLPPVVAPDGSVFIVAGPGAETVAYALGPSGQLRAGWPYSSQDDLVINVGGVSTCGYPSFYLPPFAGPDGSLHLAQNTAGSDPAGPNRVMAIGTTGKVKSGWPVTLVEAGAWFATGEVGAKGTAYGLAIEPAGTGRTECGPKQPLYSGTVLALDSHGDTIYTTTLVVP